MLTAIEIGNCFNSPSFANRSPPEQNLQMNETSTLLSHKVIVLTVLIVLEKSNYIGVILILIKES
jgi:hypothetical protein